MGYLKRLEDEMIAAGKLVSDIADRANNAECERDELREQLASKERELEAVKAKSTPPEAAIRWARARRRDLDGDQRMTMDDACVAHFLLSLVPKRKTRRDAALKAYGEIHGAAHDADFVMRYVLTAAGVDPDEEMPE